MRRQTTAARMPFQSTPSSRRETWPFARRNRRRYFNPLPPRGGRPHRHHGSGVSTMISIHSLLAEGDSTPDTCWAGWRFQSTPSSRRETRPPSRGPHRTAYFNPLPPRGGKLKPLLPQPKSRAFQSTPSSRRETPWAIPRAADRNISIHSLLAEGDKPSASPRRPACNFNPLPPRGGRRLRGMQDGGKNIFQSTPSSRRETAAGAQRPRGDAHFNPLPPRGGRRRGYARADADADISIHSLLAEGDLEKRAPAVDEPISIHSLLAEGDHT